MQQVVLVNGVEGEGVYLGQDYQTERGLNWRNNQLHQNLHLTTLKDVFHVLSFQCSMYKIYISIILL